MSPCKYNSRDILSHQTLPFLSFLFNTCTDFVGLQTSESPRRQANWRLKRKPWRRSTWNPWCLFNDWTRTNPRRCIYLGVPRRREKYRQYM